MKTKKIAFFFFLSIPITVFSANAQDTTKNTRRRPELTVVQKEFNAFRDSVKIKMVELNVRYKAHIDSILSDQRLDGKQKWEKINTANKQRNFNMKKISDKVKLKYTPKQLKP